MLCHCTCPECPRVSAFRNTLYYNVVQREQILKRKTGARRLLSSHFSHIYCEIFFLTPDAQLSLLLSTQKLCSPLPCWLAELTLPVSPSRMTARKLLQRNLKTIKYKMSRWQVAVNGRCHRGTTSAHAELHSQSPNKSRHRWRCLSETVPAAQTLRLWQRIWALARSFSDNEL